jgi:hypothetical protein
MRCVRLRRSLPGLAQIGLAVRDRAVVRRDVRSVRSAYEGEHADRVAMTLIMTAMDRTTPTVNLATPV